MEQLLQEKVNFGVAVPAMLVMILKYPGIENFDLSGINSFVTGSAPPPAWALKEFKEKWGIEIVNLWGQNECTGIGSGPLDVSDLEVRAEHFPFWGSPGFESSIKWTEGIETKIIGVDTGEVLTKPGEVGELLYKGPNVIPCYLEQPEATQAAFEEDGFFHTGDLFQVKPDSLIRFFDRKKDIIIRGGQNISAAEVENIVKGHPSLLDAAAVDMPDERLNEKVCIYVVPQPGQNITLSDITSFMKKEGVAVYKFPERLEIVDEIPRNPLGKALKGPLREDIRKKLNSESS